MIRFGCAIRICSRARKNRRLTSKARKLRVRCLCSSMPQIKRVFVSVGRQSGEENTGFGWDYFIDNCRKNQHIAGRGADSWSSRTEAYLFARSGCPGCGRRTAAVVVSEIIRLIRDGIRRESAELRIIAWNRGWGFYEPVPSPGIISALPDDVILLLDWEQGMRRKNRWPRTSAG